MREPKQREPSPAVRAKRAERKEKYVAAARELISQQGISEASVHGLARKLGLSPAALYWYFPSREALIGEVQRRVFAELAQEFSERVGVLTRSFAASSSDPRVSALGVLRSLAAFYLAMPTRSPEQARVIGFSLDPRVWLDETEATLLAPVLVRVFHELAAPFQKASEVGALLPGSATLRAVQLWSALQGVAQAGKLGRLAPRLFDVKMLGLSTTDTMLQGWGAERALMDQVRELSQALERELEGPPKAAAEAEAVTGVMASGGLPHE
jgi:AcrR family transcriptional regulator